MHKSKGDPRSGAGGAAAGGASHDKPLGVQTEHSAGENQSPFILNSNLLHVPYDFIESKTARHVCACLLARIFMELISSYAYCPYRNLLSLFLLFVASEGYPSYGGHFYGASPTSPHVPAYPTAGTTDAPPHIKHDVFGAGNNPAFYPGIA